MKQSLFLLPLLFPATLFAETVHPASPQTLVDALQKLGYQARLETDDDGDPMIRSKLEGSNYQIYFYGCSQGKDCRRILFSAGFELETPLPLASYNDWNNHKLFGRAFQSDSGASVIDYVVEAPNGMDEDTFAEVVDWWSIAISDFKDYIDF